MSDSLVIIPTYNERENVRAIIEAALGQQPALDVLVIDDNSPDGTASIVQAMIQEHPGRVNLVQRPGKQGLGTAYIEGFRWALAREQYRYVFEMDADFSHNPDDLPRLRQACVEGADMAVGSRYVSGVNVVNWPMGRVLMSFYASRYVALVTGMPVRDATAGFVCYTRRALQALDLDHVRFKGYAFQIEMKFTLHILGFRIAEVPIVFTNRVLGTSKMNSGIFGEALFGVIKLKMAAMTGKIKRRPTAQE